MTLPPKRFRLSLIDEAISLAIGYKSNTELGEDQRRELYEFVRQSQTHFDEFLNALDLCERFGGPALPEERPSYSKSPAVARFPEPPRRYPSGSGGGMEPPMFPPLPVSRRAMFGMLGATGAVVVSGACFRLSMSLSEAIRNGHIQRFSLDGGVLYASRHVKIQITHRQSLQVIRVLGEGLSRAANARFRLRCRSAMFSSKRENFRLWWMTSGLR